VQREARAAVDGRAADEVRVGARVARPFDLFVCLLLLLLPLLLRFLLPRGSMDRPPARGVRAWTASGVGGGVRVFVRGGG